MTWNELYPVVKEQAHYAVLRYDERRQDKVQELVCQAYEKYQHAWMLDAKSRNSLTSVS